MNKLPGARLINLTPEWRIKQNLIFAHCLKKKRGISKQYSTGFPRRLENLENENGHGKVMEHAKCHVILLSVMEFYQFCP